MKGDRTGRLLLCKHFPIFSEFQEESKRLKILSYDDDNEMIEAVISSQSLHV